LYRAQTNEYDYENDEDDPGSGRETEDNDNYSECNNSINVENLLDKYEDNKSVNEMTISDKTDIALMKINNDEKNYSEIMVDVTEYDLINLL